jgi:glycosyltransferase involved in cell wall biosynthesis
MEAMALRRPVVATQIAGIPELVIPRETGWLVPASSVEALAEAMTECLEASHDGSARARAGARLCMTSTAKPQPWPTCFRRARRGSIMRSE